MPLLGSRLTLRAAPGDGIAHAEADEEQPPQSRSAKIDFDNILKLIPGEVVPLYIAGRGLADASPWLVFLVCVVVSAILRIVATRAAPPLVGVNWSLVGATLAAFLLWANAVAAPLLGLLSQPVWAFLAMAFGIVAPKLVRADA